MSRRGAKTPHRGENIVAMHNNNVFAGVARRARARARYAALTVARIAASLVILFPQRLTAGIRITSLARSRASRCAPGPWTP